MTDDEMPTTPMSELAASATAAHEMFKTWVQAGFTEQQALYLLGVLIATNKPDNPDVP